MDSIVQLATNIPHGTCSCDYLSWRKMITQRHSAILWPTTKLKLHGQTYGLISKFLLELFVARIQLLYEGALSISMFFGVFKYS